MVDGRELYVVINRWVKITEFQDPKTHKEVQLSDERARPSRLSLMPRSTALRTTRLRSGGRATNGSKISKKGNDGDAPDHDAYLVTLISRTTFTRERSPLSLALSRGSSN